MAELTCPLCGATGTKNGKPFEKQGQLNLHVYHCKVKGNVSRETMGQENTENTIPVCNHNFRLLSVSSPIEVKAYKKGFMEVCIQCQTLR